MRKVETSYVVGFIAVFACVAILIHKHFPKKVQLSKQPEATNSVTTNQTVAAQIAQTPEAPQSPLVHYSTEAKRVIATEILGRDEDAFAQRFSFKCLSADQSTKKFAGYGLEGGLVVVAARFRLAMTNSSNASKWLKDFQISESIEAERFQGLDDSTTIRAVVSTLKEQIQNDAETLRVLRETKTLQSE